MVDVAMAAVNCRLLSVVCRLLLIMTTVVTDASLNLYMNSTETKRLLGQLFYWLVFNLRDLFLSGITCIP